MGRPTTADQAMPWAVLAAGRVSCSLAALPEQRKTRNVEVSELQRQTIETTTLR